MPAAAESLCLYGCPIGAPLTNRTIFRSIYVLSNNGHTKFADWVAYIVSKDTIGKTQTRIWRRDPDLPEDETLSPRDYGGVQASLHADRGHQAPLASLTSMPDWEEANFLSNITPQQSALNQGPWERLENAERILAKSASVNTVYSVTGPLYEADMPKLPNAHLSHVVPSGYWKVVSIASNDEIRVVAFIMHQDAPRSGNFCNYIVTLGSVEQRTHLMFFPDLPAEQREKLVSSSESLAPTLGCH
ncbi:MAG: DNA/RNA non-specific endonuclease [Alphaproteobacteria bacterium]